MELTPVQRVVISRAALAVLAGGLLLGGYKCLSVARWISDDYRRMPPGSADGNTGAGPFVLVGLVLLFIGGVLGLATVTPTVVFEKIMGPPRGTTLWERPDLPDTTWYRWWM